MEPPARPPRPMVIVTEGLEPAPLAWLRQRAEVLEVGISHPDFASTLTRCDGLIVRTYTKVNEDLLVRAARLRVVGRGGVGLENIDVAACRRRGIEVVYTPDANSLAVGDFVFGSILRLVRGWAYFKDKALPPDEFKRVRGA